MSDMSSAKMRYSPRPCACGCGGHPRNYYAKYISGHRPKSDPLQRFWAKVDKAGDCWLWTGATASHGYGHFWDGRVFILAHRYSLVIAQRLTDPSLHVDHLCRNRICVRPEHLELVTQGENNIRALPYRRIREHCRRGHAFAQTGFINSNGYRECRECITERRRARARG